MALNLKLKPETDLALDILRTLLLEKDEESKIYALRQVNAASCNELINEIKICAYDYRPLVRANAYLALRFSRNLESITEIIRDSLRDNNKDAYQAALLLFDKFKNC